MNHTKKQENCACLIRLEEEKSSMWIFGRGRDIHCTFSFRCSDSRGCRDESYGIIKCMEMKKMNSGGRKPDQIGERNG